MGMCQHFYDVITPFTFLVTIFTTYLFKPLQLLFLDGGYTYPKWNSRWREFLLCYARFTLLHFAYISHRLHFGSKANFVTWSMIKEKDFSQFTFSPFKKMDERKQLIILISCLSSLLTSALLLQLQAVIALKIAQQQSHYVIFKMKQ